MVRWGDEVAQISLRTCPHGSISTVLSEGAYSGPVSWDTRRPFCEEERGCEDGILDVGGIGPLL